MLIPTNGFFYKQNPSAVLPSRGSSGAGLSVNVFQEKSFMHPSKKIFPGKLRRSSLLVENKIKILGSEGASCKIRRVTNKRILVRVKSEMKWLDH
jgi:hypothetical protein